MSDTKEILNSEEVEFLLEATDADSTAEMAAEPGSHQSITMRGDLEQMQLADIFQTLNLAKMEGLLKVSNPVEQRMVHFHAGSVRILVPPRSMARRLGQRLIHSSLLEPEQLRLALLEQRKTHKRLGEILVAQGFVEQHHVDELLTVQITEELFGLFTWEHGDFEFYRGPVEEEAVNELLDACPKFEINSLLLEVARRADEWGDILESLHSLDEIPVTTELDNDFDIESLGETHQAVLLAVDGRTSFRELSEATALSVFDCARAARDLVREDMVVPCDDEHLLQVARWHHEHGDNKKALMVAMTLGDRRGDCSLDLIRELAQLTHTLGEQQLGCQILLEAAQLQTDVDLALELAQEARALNPRNLEALSFLRSTMCNHLPPDAEEVGQITLDLLDGLLHDNEIDQLLELVEEIQHGGTANPEVMMRQARALAKRKDNAAAIDILLKVGRSHAENGDTNRQLEAYELASRLDRNRKDIDRLIRQLRSTSTIRLARWGAIVATVLLLAVGGLAWYYSVLHRGNVLIAANEVGKLLEARQYDEAEEALASWRDRLGACSTIDDLTQQLRFGRVAEQKRQQQIAHRQRVGQLKQAADLVQKGLLAEAFAAYGALRTDPDVTEKIDEAARTRIDALAKELDNLSLLLVDRIPAPPDEFSSQTYVETTLEKLRHLVPAETLRAGRAILAIADTEETPASLDATRWQDLLMKARRSVALMERTLTLTTAFEAAAERFAKQRRLDPLFQTALQHESRYEFAEALAAYRELHESNAGSVDLHAHLKVKIEQLEGIVSMCNTLAAATNSGDFATAAREYQTLQRLAPEVPFAKILRLPLTVTSSMPGATVLWDNQPVGKTPCLIAYQPDRNHFVKVELPRFRPISLQVPDNHNGHLDLVLTLEPDLELELDAGTDRVMQADADGRVFVTLSSGTLLAVDAENAQRLWQTPAADIQNVSNPVVDRGSVFTASLDGPLRAFSAANGRMLWQQDGLSSEYAPAVIEDRLVVATTEGDLVMVHLKTGEEIARWPLPGPMRSELLSDGKLLFAALEDGTNVCLDARRQKVVWRSRPHKQGQQLSVTPSGLLALDDDGQIQSIDPRNGATRWQRQMATTPMGKLATNSKAALVTLDSHIETLDLKTGQTLWSAPRTSQPWAGPARFLGNHIAAPTRDGSILVFGEDDQLPRYCLVGDRGASMTGEGSQFAVVANGRKLRLYRRLP